jgi:hypothetical protein
MRRRKSNAGCVAPAAGYFDKAAHRPKETLTGSYARDIPLRVRRISTNSDQARGGMPVNDPAQVVFRGACQADDRSNCQGGASKRYAALRCQKSRFRVLFVHLAE